MHNVRLLKWFNLFLDFRPYAPFAIIYFAHVTGSYASALAVFSVATVAAAIFELPTGVISDFMGRKRTMMWGSVSSVLAITFFALGGSFLILAVGAVLEGLARALFSGNNNALLYDTLAETDQKEKFGEWLGKVSSMFQVGLAISAFLGGFLAEISLPVVMWASVVPQIAGLFITFFIVEPRKHTAKVPTNVFAHLMEALQQFRTNAKLRLLSLAKIIDYGLGETMHEFGPAFIALLWPTWAIGAARTISHTSAAISFWFSGKFIKRFSALKGLFAAAGSSKLLSLISYAYPTMVSPFLLSINSLSFGVSLTSQNVLLHEQFTDAQRATTESLNSLLGSLLFAVIAIPFGMLADNLGPTRALLIGTVVSSVTLILYWRLFRGSKAAVKLS